MLGLSLMTSTMVSTAFRNRMEKRSLSRMRLSCPSNLARLDGSLEFPVRCADLSPYGALVVAKEAVTVGSTVVLGIPSLQLWAEGRVRHCRRRVFRYLVGIEFSNGSRWFPSREEGTS